MKAIILNGFGSVENLEMAEILEPYVQPDEVLICSKALGINPVDIKTRKRLAQAHYVEKAHPMVLGWDVSGVVTKIGTAVRDYKVGDEVFGLVNFPGNGRAYAEYVAAPAAQITLKPNHISHEEAVAACLAALTAWKALVTLGKIKARDRVLVHGASGGVGHFAVQIAKYFGAYVVGTASAINKEFVMGLGADECIDYRTQCFEEVVKEMDIILDSVGGENFSRSLTILKPTGTIISLPSDKAEENKKIAEEKHIAHYYQMLVESNGEAIRSIAGLLQQGKLKSYIFKVFPFDEIPLAQIQVEVGKTVGKVVAKV